MRGLPLFAALLALALQAFVVQPHVHAIGPAAVPPLQAHLHAGEPTDSRPTLTDAERSPLTTNGAHIHAAHIVSACEICIALAASGRAALPDATALTAPAAAPLQPAVAALSTPPRALTHIWQSRAPPIAL
ncbi:MAG: hypothetical protein R3C16_12100 [Hyphomonadaceae bacterium]